MGEEGARDKDWLRHGGITCVLQTQFSSFPLKNSPKNLDPSNKIDLDLLDCLGR